ncbi:hypothetical protein AB1L30_14200 [Bremerella sp. JC817]|uniref:hypothetical protein n=1 Tax=Bremerella sp. JC817 TaxID=3231756 RepID=UPI0034597436
MFDLPPEPHTERRFQVELPGLDQPWQVGLIVGPSGSGKTTVAAAAYGRRLRKRLRWRRDRAVVDGFDRRLSTRAITQALVACGLGSPPAWCRPYHTLSTGEQFRADLARGLASPGKLLVLDEFTSVVDRPAARLACHAVRRALDRKTFAKRLIAVTCHEDVARWLRPDWVLRMPAGTLTRRCLRRPRLRLEIFRCRHDVWPMFAPHHYLTSKLNHAARCYAGLVDGEVATFAATLNHFRPDRLRISRLVTLPKFQGVGLGGAMLDGMGSLLSEAGAESITINAGHPAVIGHCNRSAKWEFRRLYKTGRKPSGMYLQHPHWKTSAGRAVATFRWKFS